MFRILLLVSFLSSFLLAGAVPNTLTWTVAPTPTQFVGFNYAACFSSPLSPSPSNVTSSISSLGGLRIPYGGAVMVVSDFITTTDNSSVFVEGSPLPDARYYGGAVQLANGNLAYFGGLNGNGDPTSDIVWSQNNGTVWYGSYNMPWYQYQATTPWTPRFGFGWTVPPGTNTIILTGGGSYGGGSNTGPNTNDVWVSTDGLVGTDTFTAPSWYLANPAGPLSSHSEGVALASLYNTHTLVLAGGIDRAQVLGYTNDVYTSTNYGTSWTSLKQRSFPVRSQHSLLVDTDNVLYIVGGIGIQTVYRDAWLSVDVGQTWVPLTVYNPTPYLQNACNSLRYVYAPMGVVQKQVVSYAGKSASTGQYPGVYVANLTHV